MLTRTNKQLAVNHVEHVNMRYGGKMSMNGCEEHNPWTIRNLRDVEFKETLTTDNDRHLGQDNEEQVEAGAEHMEKNTRKTQILTFLSTLHLLWH